MKSFKDDVLKPRAASLLGRAWDAHDSVLWGALHRASVVEEVVVHDSTFGGLISVGSRSDVAKRLVRHGGYEPLVAEAAFAHISPGSDVLDVGANIGLYTVGFGLKCSARNVLSFEPSAAAASRLRWNVIRNGLEDVVEVVERGASDRPGELELAIVEGREEYASFGQPHRSTIGADSASMLVPVTTVDLEVARTGLEPTFMKIDVEGWETSVLLGAQKTIESFRPVIMIEVVRHLLQGAGSSSEAVFQHLSDQNYEGFDPVTMAKWDSGNDFDGEVLFLPCS